ncbi:beta-N-acetylhexosaminidase [Paenibacillus sp. N1-5-1-14]|uniref:beta-N-acetylhexosaminidase n=1 Tax=Paenibacillus radicibacter TaxID=2972488 RepID=UPI002158D3B1|nr:beta-N-acetylhexosaminidase [Paenibacillus radicibacter]MCR8641320.1 beta-N-acetylhexosaminidase [Paenibacillus radicibacter]
MKIHLQGDLTDDMYQGVSYLENEMKFELHPDGLLIHVKQQAGPLVVICDEQVGTIHYEQPVHFYRALGLFLENMQFGKRFHETETPQFETVGVMFDVSRNGVLRVDSIKRFIRLMAVMGMDTLMLYTEDTYTIEDLPYFGYMRGKYSFEELKECDDYAAIFGIEMVPCIQTLGHLTQALKWDYANGIRDTDDILLVSEEKTYQFIEKMITSIMAPFRSKRIHIGMDEAHGLGLGKYLDNNGYQKRFDLMNAHLHQVLAITEKHGLEPMIWSDMYFRLGSKHGRYYDPDVHIPQEVIDGMPAGVQYVYWDYYHADQAFYEDYIQRHQAFGSNPIFAGGVWTWTGIVPNYGKTLRTTNAGLQACKQLGVKEVIATMWGDNGAEGNYYAGLLGLQLFAEHAYAADVLDEKLARRFHTCTGGNYEAFMNVKYLDETPGTTLDNLEEANPSRYLLWQDLLLGMFDHHVAALDLVNHYTHWEAKLQGYADTSGEWSFLFDVYVKLSRVLRLKCDLGVRIKQHYDNKDLARIKHLVDHDLVNLTQLVHELRAAHRKQWFMTNKAFGWEVIDIRYGGLIARLESTAYRLAEYTYGLITEIEELEESRLVFESFYGWEEGSLGHCNLYHRIVTPSSFI